MPECLECKVEIEFDDTVDIYSDSDIVVFYEVGYCPKCGKIYKWRDVYKFSHFEDLEEV